MSRQYKRPEDVPIEKITARLDQLWRAVTKGNRDEFFMRIPAECDRDADFVISAAQERLDKTAAIVHPDAIEEYIRTLPWHEDTPDAVKTYVAGNIRALAHRIRDAIVLPEPDTNAETKAA